MANPNNTLVPITVTFYKADGSTIQQPLLMSPTSRMTLELQFFPGLEAANFSTSVVSTHGLPIAVERTMWWDFGDNPLYSGGHDSSGANAPSTSWFLAEGATGSFFDTFVLIANPNDVPATVTTTYLPTSGVPVAKTHAIAAHQRLTINIADEDPALTSAAIGTTHQRNRHAPALARLR